MGDFGELLGILTIILFSIAISNYLVKFVNKTWGKQIAKFPRFKSVWTIVMRIIVKYHRYFGVAALLTLGLHFYIQSTYVYLSTSGILAGSLLLAQFALGVYGAYINKKRKGLWFITHRIISVLLLIAILNHVLF